MLLYLLMFLIFTAPFCSCNIAHIPIVGLIKDIPYIVNCRVSSQMYYYLQPDRI